MKVLTYVEVDIDYCSHTYGVAPCTASIPTTGDIKCFNCRKTCQDIANFDDVGATLRFAKPTAYLPKDIECIPSIDSFNFTPAVISLGENLGQRATLNVTFNDHPHGDAGAGFDKYLADRVYNPFTQGSFFGKFRARHPFLQERAIRLIIGELGLALADMETRHYIIESFDGPSLAGKYTLTAKDVLKLADGDRAQAPVLNTGFLVGAVTDTATVATLSPTGIGDAEYPTSGYINLGGKEICAFVRDDVTKLLLHFEGADASTTFTDSSPVPHTVTPAGNAQIDTAQFKFGAASGLFDGTGDHLLLDGSSDFAFGTGDFTVEMFIRLNATGAAKTLYDSRPNATNGAYVDIFVDASNHLGYIANNVQQITGTTALTTGVWYHVALCRSGTNTKLFLNGVQEGSTYSGDSTSYLNPASRPAIGNAGSNLASTFSWNGWIDEVRVLKGYAAYTGTFTPPAAALAPFGHGGDILYFTARAQFNTIAASHAAQDRAQLCLQYSGQDVADIIYDLWVTYAGVDASLIDHSEWQDETAAFLGTLYTALIAEPTSVNTLISELIEQAALAQWWDDEEQKIKLQVLRGITTDVDRFTRDNVLKDTYRSQEQPSKRISQVWTYFGQINPLVQLTDTNNFRSVARTPDADSEDAEADYGAAAIKKIFSRWIPAGGRSVADRLNEIQFSRFRDPPRQFNLSVLRGSVTTPKLGIGYRLEAKPIQDETGAATDAPIQLVQLDPRADIIAATAEEMLFRANATDLTNRQIILDANINNVNLRDLHDAIYPDAESGDTVTCTIYAGIIVGAASTSQRAFDVGSWAAGVTVNLVVRGRIQGAGGKGGDHPPFGSATDGEDGGVALYTRYAIALSGTGAIFGGAGGGASADGFFVHAGGGGAGTAAGPGGNADGLPGTADAGGAPGGTGATAGGGPGLDAADSSTQLGGDAGAAIDGVSFVTGTVSDRRGPTIN